MAVYAYGDWIETLELLHHFRCKAEDKGKIKRSQRQLQVKSILWSQWKRASSISNSIKQLFLRRNIQSLLNSLNAWKLRTMIWDRGTNTNSLYINGNYIGGGSASNTSGTSIYDGGGIVFGSLYGWKHFGRRSIIKIYNKVLSTSEILQNFYAMRGRFGL